MPLSKDQISTLLALVASATEDDMSCDGCFEHVAQFVETELAGAELCESMLKIQNHLQNCPCCKDEYNALKEAMLSLEG
jgi:predicted anti-sigma-YlaC factor YlaD